MGSLRFYLAMAVLCSHIGPVPGVPALDPGTAVYCFFVLSGFYMAMGLNERYPTHASNRTFYLARVLRIWPTYLLSLLLLIPTGELQRILHASSQAPFAIAALAYVSNLGIFGLDLLAHVSARNGFVVFSEYGIDRQHNGTSFMLNLPAWSLSIEMLFYLAAPFVVRGFRRCLAFFLVGVATHWFFRSGPGAAWTASFRFDLLYPFLMAYFGLGMLAYWLHARGSNHASSNYWRLAVAVTCALALQSAPDQGFLDQAAMGFGFAAFALSLPYLFEWTRRSRVDKLLGDLSFPIYILHMPLSALLRWAGIAASTWAYFAAVMIASALTLLLIEYPIERVRASLRDRMARRANSGTTDAIVAHPS